MSVFGHWGNASLCCWFDKDGLLRDSQCVDQVMVCSGPNASAGGSCSRDVIATMLMHESRTLSTV